MGQQQLLLLVLSTVIVGLATVAGIQAFSENQAQSNADALTQQALNYASDLQAHYQKPEQFGGSGSSWPSDLTVLNGVSSTPVDVPSGKVVFNSNTNSCSSISGTGSNTQYMIAGGDNDGDGTYGDGDGDNLVCVAFNGNEVIGTAVEGIGSTKSHSF